MPSAGLVAGNRNPQKEIKASKLFDVGAESDLEPMGSSPRIRSGNLKLGDRNVHLLQQESRRRV